MHGSAGRAFGKGCHLVIIRWTIYMNKVIVMAGGSGICLWPLSRAAHPKQFLALHDEDTILQATFKSFKK